MTRRRVTVAVGSAEVMAIAAVAAVLAAPSRATFPVRNGRLMVLSVSGRGNSFRKLITINPDGTDERTRVVERGAADFAVSPDGRHLAHHNGIGILVSDRDGHHRRRIVRDGDLPSWSPDGTQIVYSGGHQIGYAGNQLYIASLDGRSRKLHGAVGSQPAWSPDGRSIAFAHDSGTREELMLVPASGGKPRVLYRPTYVLGRAFSPDWSPDGRQIVFTVLNEQPECEDCPPAPAPPAPTQKELARNGVNIIGRDGTGIRRISTLSFSAPVWSPDGRQIAFLCFNPLLRQPGGVCVIDPHGHHRRRVFSTKTDLWAPIRWLPR